MTNKNYHRTLGLFEGIVERVFLLSGLLFSSLSWTASTIAEETKAPAPPVARSEES